MADSSTNAGASVQERLASVRMIAMDVDGVLTDGSVELVLNGPEVKRFNVADGLGSAPAEPLFLVLFHFSSLVCRIFRGGFRG